MTLDKSGKTDKKDEPAKTEKPVRKAPAKKGAAARQFD